MLARGSRQGDLRMGTTARIAGRPVHRLRMIVDPRSTRAVHGEISRQLSGVQVSLAPTAHSQDVPSSVELVLTLERMLLRASGKLGERRTADGLGMTPVMDDPDLTFDFSAGAATSGRTLRVLYDGLPGECALMAALFAGRIPSIELQDAASGEIVSSVCPGAENSATITAALEAALAGLVTLIVCTVRGWGTRIEKPAAPTPGSGLQALAKLRLKALTHAAVRRIYVLCCHTPHWRVCWRFVDGPDLWDTRTLENTTWQVLPDPGTHFYADPFPFTHQGQTYVFVEDLDHRTNKGVISVIPFGATGPAGGAQVVLEEPFHLSYPFVFERDGQIWMIPETSANNAITLYRAERFPDRWVKEADLLTGLSASDATIVEHGGLLWMFATTWNGAGSFSDTLSIFSSAALCGPWKPHAGNPVLVDQSSARPAGAFVRRDGRLWRPVQDCRDGYGTGIGLAEVTRLDAEGYAQTVHSVVKAPSGWPGRRLHTLNRAGTLEVIDGAAHSPRSRFLAGHLETWSGRRGLPH
jgi:hypothetical protein